MAYLCNFCTYADLVLERFVSHNTEVHRRDVTAEDCFRPVVVFWSLLECQEPHCVFLTNTEYKLARHMDDHVESDGPDERALSVRMEQLDEVTQAALVRQQRADMEEPSRLNKGMERARGLVSPPFRLDVAAPPKKDPESPEKIREEDLTPGELVRRLVQGGHASLKCFGTGRFLLDMRPHDARGPASPRRRLAPALDEDEVSESLETRMRDRVRTSRQPLPRDNSYTRARGARQGVMEYVKNLRMPPRNAHAVLLPLEIAARRRPATRYIAEFQREGTYLYVSFQRLPQPGQGAVTLRQQTSLGDLMVSGAAVTLVTGAPEAKKKTPPLMTAWTIVGPVFDVQTRPWSVIRKMQLALWISPGFYYYNDVENTVQYEVEAFTNY